MANSAHSYNLNSMNIFNNFYLIVYKSCSILRCTTFECRIYDLEYYYMKYVFIYYFGIVLEFDTPKNYKNTL